MVVGAKVCEFTGGFLWFVYGLYVGILTSPLSISVKTFFSDFLMVLWIDNSQWRELWPLQQLQCAIIPKVIITIWHESFLNVSQGHNILYIQ